MLGAIKCSSFSKDARGHGYINICVDAAGKPTAGSGQVGIDLGLQTTAAMSNGQKYDGLHAYRAMGQSLGKAQRPRKNTQVKALHAKVKKRRLDGLHKLFTQLVRDSQWVVLGDVSRTTLAKTKMATSVCDAGRGLAKGMLRYKSLAKGAAYREVNEAYSSQ